MIKTIILDLGGVYFEDGTPKALQAIYGLVNAEKEKIDEIFRGFPRKEGFLYRKGKLTKKEFWQAAINKLKISSNLVPRLQEIWHSSYKPVQGMKRLVSDLRKNHKVIVFSGNIRERIKYLDRKYGLRKHFDGFVFSFDIGFTKNEPEMYEILAGKIKCRPEDCVFIDERQENLDRAQIYGFKTILFRDAKQLRADLRKLGVH